MSMRRVIKGIALATTLSLSALSVGCYGKFQLTRMIYDLNRSVEDKYVRSAVTWAFVIVPVYGFSAFLDFVVFNVVEFWTGENPMAVTRVHTEGTDTMAMTLSRDGKGTLATLDRFRAGKRMDSLVIRDAGDGVVRASLFENGLETRHSVARLGADGAVTVDGRAAGAAFSVRHAPAEVETLQARFKSLPGIRG
ncbi:MAG TPA: DUF3332 family protein [Candidatus Deferrimicrobiaceae bacterium]|jgi:hypothetical protein